MNYTRLRAVNTFVRSLSPSWFPSGLIDDPRISPEAKAVAAKIGLHVNRETGHCAPLSIAEICDSMGRRERWVRYCLRELQLSRWLVRKRLNTGSIFYMWTGPPMELIPPQSDRKTGIPTGTLSAGGSCVPPAHCLPVAFAENSCTTGRQRAGGTNSLRSSISNDDEREDHPSLPVVAPAGASSSSSILKINGVTTKQIRAIVAAGRTDAQIREWVDALPDFVAENGPFRKNAAAVLVAALSGPEPWPLPDRTLLRRQLELRAEADELEKRRARVAEQREELSAEQRAEVVARARAAAGFGARRA